MHRRSDRSAMNGVVQGAEAVRSIVTYIRTLYDHQEFKFAGPYGENGFLEDYTAHVRGEQVGNVVLVTRNAAGQAQHIVANYRPRTTLLLLSRLIRRASSPAPPTASTSPPAPRVRAHCVAGPRDTRARCPRDIASSVGVAGFEPTASSSRTKRATKLRHTPLP